MQPLKVGNHNRDEQMISPLRPAAERAINFFGAAESAFSSEIDTSNILESAC